jgi:hypothetical protein
MLIDPLMTDPQTLLLFQPARDLFRAPFLSQQAFHRAPGCFRDARNRFRSPLDCFFLGLLRSVATLTAIAFQLTTHTRLVHSNHCRDLGLGMLGFLKRIYLVSLLLGELVIGSHCAPLTWSSEKHYPTPAYLSAIFKVALQS